MSRELSASMPNVRDTSQPEAERAHSFGSVWKRNWILYAMLVPAAICLILFHYYPLWGLSVAFVDYNPYKGVLGSDFVGLGNFQSLFRAPDFGAILRNTVSIATGKLVIGQLASVVFALLLDQIRQSTGFYRMVQTVTTLPHFMSWVIIGSAMVQLLSTTGPVNRALGTRISFMGDPKVFPWTLIMSGTWKGFGFGAVVYLAALAGINPELYEAAAVDGAGPLSRVWHITLPGIKPTVILMACLNLGQILNAGFEQVLVLYNPMVYSTGDILDTYVYRAGILEAKFSLATSVGLIKSTVGFVLILLSYWLADRLANYRVF